MGSRDMFINYVYTFFKAYLQVQMAASKLPHTSLADVGGQVGLSVAGFVHKLGIIIVLGTSGISIDEHQLYELRV